MMKVRKSLEGHAAGVALKGLVVASAMTLASPVFAQGNVDGSIYGSAPSGAEKILIEGNGQTVTVTPDADGEFRVNSLPVGQYTITVKRSGGPDLVKKALVRIGTGTNVIFQETDSGTTDLGALEVVGASVSPIDISSVETAVNFSDIQLAEMPVARNLTSVALLAPGTVKGDAAFGNLASFGGASVGENVYYLNGFNITNFRTGLGYANIPYQFFSDFQIKTSGYSAEFGRSTGGVVNATSKRGTNELKFNANVYWEPKDLREKSPSSFYIDDVTGDRVYLRDNSGDEYEDRRINLSASGALIKDRLFFYALYEYRDIEEEFISSATAFSRERDNPFYAIKLDGVIAPGHNLEFTYYKNEDEVFDYSDTAPIVYDLGGDTTIVRYTGQMTDWMTVSAMYGKSKLKDNQTVAGTYAYDRNFAAFVGTATTSLYDFNEDEREAVRLDVTFNLGDHKIKAGYDNEKLEVGNNDGVVGDSVVAVNFPDANENGIADEMTQPQRYVYALDYTYVQIDNYINDGSFETDSSALYIEDNWRINDRLTAYLGLRNETFDNKNVVGESFIKVDDQLAPRLGIAYDLLGNGKSKLYATYGRQYIPVATNTNIRLAGAETYYRALYEIDVDNPYDENGVPNVTDPDPLALAVYADGSVHPTVSTVSKNIDPQYQDEYVIGYQMSFADRWQAGLSFIRRDLKSTIEDIAVDAGLNAYAAANGYDDFEAGGFDYYVLTNPGKDLDFEVDLDGDGELEEVLLTAEMLGYPEAERYYNAVELTIERIFDGKWSVQGSYTWSQSYGNVEGYVKSDNGQDDAGLTTSFDQPGLTDYSYGYLPNDRRHKLKLFGSYRVHPEVIVGASASAYSGRPINAFGNHPTDVFAAEYGSESFYSFGEPNPRGSRGRTPWTYNLDVSARYMPSAVRGLTLGVDIFNIFDFDSETEVYEIEEEDYSPGTPDPFYKLPTAYQEPRYFRFSVEYQFTM